MKKINQFEIKPGATLICINSEMFSTAYSTSAFTEDEVTDSIYSEINDAITEGCKDAEIPPIYAVKAMAKVAAEADIHVYRPSVDGLKALSGALYELFVNGDSEALDEYQENIAKLPDEFVKYVKDLAD